MVQLARLAVGTVQPGADPQPLVWALLEAFRREGVLVQSYLSRADFPRYQGAMSITGLHARHLDSWLMSPDMCRALLRRAARLADLALVEGDFAPPSYEGQAGGQLEPLCQWLDLPRLAVLDTRRLTRCRLPELPPGIEGLLLDGTPPSAPFVRLAMDMESLLGVPVLGALEAEDPLRAALDRVPRGEGLPPQLSRALGDRLTQWWKPGEILSLAGRRDLPRPQGPCPLGCTSPTRRPTVAIAYDEAFNGYFPDTLELLESLGASVVGFSPLRDEHLPPQAEIVYFGCGHPERYAAALADNHCLVAALRSHWRAGRLVYGQGGGAAYLCRQMEASDGTFRRMAGIIPAVARFVREPVRSTPAELTLSRPTWLADAGMRLRGYRNPNWRLEVADQAACLSAQGPDEVGLWGDFQTVGSLVHLNLVARPDLLGRFFLPRRRKPEAHEQLCVRSLST